MTYAQETTECKWFYDRIIKRSFTTSSRYESTFRVRALVLAESGSAIAVDANIDVDFRWASQEHFVWLH